MSKYKIGQLSKTMGVSTHLLKHYEKFQLVEPMKNSDTNYRYYDLRQCGRIIEAKKFRNLGFSIKDTAGLLNEYTNDQLNTALMTKVDELEEQIKELQKQHELGQELIEDSNRCDCYLNQWFVEDCREVLFYQQSKEEKLLEKTMPDEENENLMIQLPAYKSVVVIHKDSFYQDEIEYQWGIGITKNKITKQQEEEYRTVVGGRTFITYVKVEVPFMNNNILTNKIKGIYHQFTDKISSDVVAQLVKIVHEEGKEYQYFKVYIPL